VPHRLRDSVDDRYIEEEVDFTTRRAWNRQHQLAMYAGYKFEELSTLSRPSPESTQQEIERRNDNVVDNIQQYCSIVKTQIGSSTLIMGGEVDCIWGYHPTPRLSLIVDYKPDPPQNPVPHYVELKTSRKWIGPRDKENFERHKLLKFWAQSFLLGVPKIIVGFRSNDNILASLETFQTEKIPTKGKIRGWDEKICINFAAKFLEFLRGTIVEDCVYGIKFVKKGRQIDVFKKDQSKSFLTAEYINWKSK
jgi:RAT1-interacting protein